VSEWQPIETAPKDGTDIIVCSAWIMADGAYRIGWVADGYFDGDCWVFGSFDVDPEDYSAPTHWMPLSAPLVAAASGLAPASMLSIFSQRMRVARAASKRTLHDVAKAVGVSAQAVGKWEAGHCYPRASELTRACQYLGCSLDWIMTFEPVDLTLGQTTNGLQPLSPLPTAIRKLGAGDAS
jgi:DNA-binding XRE family transcriptional regulator